MPDSTCTRRGLALVVVVCDLSSVKGGHADGENGAFQLSQVEAKGAADRGMIHAEQLGVQPDVPGVPGIVVVAKNEFLGISKLPEDIGGTPIEFQPFRHHHVRRLNVKPGILNFGHRQLSICNKMVQ